MRNLCSYFGRLGWIAAFAFTGTGHAQVPEGYLRYEGHSAEFTIALPLDWTVYRQVQLAGQPGMLIFTSSSPKGLGFEEQMEVMSKMDTGELPNFFLERTAARQGMSCASFAEKAQKDVVKLVQRSFSPGSKVQSPRTELVDVGGCHGVRIRVDAKSKTGADWATDVRAVSDGTTLYLFTLRTHSASVEQNQGYFDSAMNSLRLAAAKSAG